MTGTPSQPVPGAAAAPSWFTEAIGYRPERVVVPAAGSQITVRCWGPPDASTVVLVHGGAAHAGWWDHVAPLLAREHRVLAPDLSGHGDSGRRAAYDLSTWAAEVLAVAALARAGAPVLVGHSLGGRVALTAAGIDPGAVAGVAMIDTPLDSSAPDERWLERWSRPLRVYRTVEEAGGRFATLPPQDIVLGFVRDHLVAESVRPVPGGWSWKFDPGIFINARGVPHDPAALPVPGVLFRCEHGLVSAARAQGMSRVLGPALRIVELPACGHHPMLDRPLELVSALNTMLALLAHPSQSPG